MSEFVLSGQELFGRYARIAYGHALDGKQDYHIYKCIRSFMSNCYCDVPLTYQTENNCHTHDNIVEVVNVIHCGIDENRVIRVARNDIELLPAPDVEPVQQWIPVTERLPERDKEVLLIVHGWEDRLYYTGCLHRQEAERSWLTGIESKASDWKIWGFSYLREPIVTHWMPLPEPPKEVET